MGGPLLIERLQVGQFLVDAAFGNQLVMLAAFNDLAFLQDDDFIGILDGRQAVGNDDGSALLHDF